MIMMSDKVETARPNISLTNIAEFLIPIPPLKEQQRIVKEYSMLSAVADSLKTNP